MRISWVSLITNVMGKISRPKKTSPVYLHGTYEGKLYIEPYELFKEPKIQELLKAVAESEAVKSLNKSKAI